MSKLELAKAAVESNFSLFRGGEDIVPILREIHKQYGLTSITVAGVSGDGFHMSTKHAVVVIVLIDGAESLHTHLYLDRYEMEEMDVNAGDQDGPLLH